MNTLYLRLKNCYGIGEMEETIDYSNNKCAIIYAPNGTMKTSLTNVFNDILNKKQPCDLFYPDRVTSYNINFDGNPVTLDKLYVFKNR